MVDADSVVMNRTSTGCKSKQKQEIPLKEENIWHPVAQRQCNLGSCIHTYQWTSHCIQCTTLSQRTRYGWKEMACCSTSETWTMLRGPGQILYDSCTKVWKKATVPSSVAKEVLLPSYFIHNEWGTVIFGKSAPNILYFLNIERIHLRKNIPGYHIVQAHPFLSSWRFLNERKQKLVNVMSIPKNPERKAW